MFLYWQTAEEGIWTYEGGRERRGVWSELQIEELNEFIAPEMSLGQSCHGGWEEWGMLHAWCGAEMYRELRWESNIKMIFKEVDGRLKTGLIWLHYREEWWSVLNVVMNIWVP